MGALKEPHGGELKVRYLGEHAAEERKEAAGDVPTWDLTAHRVLVKLEALDFIR